MVLGGRGRDESVDSRFEDDLKDYIKDNDLDELTKLDLRFLTYKKAKSDWNSRM